MELVPIFIYRIDMGSAVVIMIIYRMVHCGLTVTNMNRVSSVMITCHDKNDRTIQAGHVDEEFHDKSWIKQHQNRPPKQNHYKKNYCTYCLRYDIGLHNIWVYTYMY